MGLPKGGGIGVLILGSTRETQSAKTSVGNGGEVCVNTGG
jgi:hypothetical protein